MVGDTSSLRIPALISNWADTDLRARFIVDDDLSITWQNTAASRLLASVDIFRTGTSALLLQDNRQRATFRRFIRSSGNTISRLCIACAKQDHLLLTAVVVTGSDSPRRIGLTVHSANSVVSVGAGTLESAFRLTPSECRVVETLFAGNTPEQIGGRLHLSVGTVRVHIKHLYEKLNVRSREAMFHKVLPFMIS